MAAGRAAALANDLLDEASVLRPSLLLRHRWPMICRTCRSSSGCAAILEYAELRQAAAAIRGGPPSDEELPRIRGPLEMSWTTPRWPRRRPNQGHRRGRVAGVRLGAAPGKAVPAAVPRPQGAADRRADPVAPGLFDYYLAEMVRENILRSELDPADTEIATTFYDVSSLEDVHRFCAGRCWPPSSSRRRTPARCCRRRKCAASTTRTSWWN